MQKEREAATKAVRDELGVKAVEEYRNVAVVALDKEAIAGWSMDELNAALARQDDHLKALALDCDSATCADKGKAASTATIEANRLLLVEAIDEALSKEMTKVRLDPILVPYLQLNTGKTDNKDAGAEAKKLCATM